MPCSSGTTNEADDGKCESNDLDGDSGGTAQVASNEHDTPLLSITEASNVDADDANVVDSSAPEAAEGTELCGDGSGDDAAPAIEMDIESTEDLNSGETIL